MQCFSPNFLILLHASFRQNTKLKKKGILLWKRRTRCKKSTSSFSIGMYKGGISRWLEYKYCGKKNENGLSTFACWLSENWNHPNRMTFTESNLISNHEFCKSTLSKIDTYKTLAYFIVRTSISFSMKVVILCFNLWLHDWENFSQLF